MSWVDWVIAAVIAVWTALLGAGLVWTGAFERPPEPWVAVVRTPTGMGTAFAVRATPAEIYFVTAGHVVDAETLILGPIEVDGRTARIVADSDDPDLAVLAIPNIDASLAPPTFRSAEFGEPCIADGWSMGGAWTPVRLRHSGSVCSTDFDGLVCFDGGGRPGMSGSPVIAGNGDVIGVLSQGTLAWGVPNSSEILCVPGETVGAFVSESLRSGP